MHRVERRGVPGRLLIRYHAMRPDELRARAKLYDDQIAELVWERDLHSRHADGLTQDITELLNRRKSIAEYAESSDRSQRRMTSMATKQKPAKPKPTTIRRAGKVRKALRESTKPRRAAY